LRKDGFTVVVNYSGDVKSADTLVREDRGHGGRALAVKADVADTAAVRALFDQAEKAFGGVDVLINNAGIMSLQK